MKRAVLHLQGFGAGSYRPPLKRSQASEADLGHIVTDLIAFHTVSLDLMKAPAHTSGTGSDASSSPFERSMEQAGGRYRDRASTCLFPQGLPPHLRSWGSSAHRHAPVRERYALKLIDHESFFDKGCRE
jgi:hypothetical protein